MAGEWIKMRTDLLEDPVVFKLASLLKSDRLTIIGRLYAFWAWADKHAVDGRVDGASSLIVDDITRCDGFAQALVAVKWLTITDDSIALPKHERHNGESAKERAMKNARQARWREGKDSKQSTDVDAPPSTKPSTREEKRREEKKEDSVAKATGGKPPMSPDEIIFGYGVPLLTSAGSTDKHARSFLGGLRKAHGDDAVVSTLRECIRAKPLQPTEWLAAAMPPKATGKHVGFETKNYREGVTADGTLT